MATTSDRPLRGIILKLFSVFLIVTMLTLIKMVDSVPILEVMFFRSFFAIVPIVIWLTVQKEWNGAFRTGVPQGHILRSTIGILTMGLTFVAVRRIPLAEAITLQYSQPLFVVAISAIVLGEVVRAFRWGAVIVGFAGVLIITLPNIVFSSKTDFSLSNNHFLGVVAALLGAMTNAVTVLLIGNLVKTENSTTIVLWFWMVASTILGAMSVFDWITPSPEDFAILFASGLLGGLSQLLLSESLRNIGATTIAPLEYVSLIFATIYGIAIFGDVLPATTFAGAGVIIIAGMAIIWREGRKGAVRRAPVIPPN